jgi:cytosine/adenosine deaminase-related metal-dependent hydrolase
MAANTLRILHTAEILLPMGGREPIRDAGVIVDDEGRILDAGPFTSLPPNHDIRYNHPVLIPGVLNCHVHLTDAVQIEPVPGGEGLNRWVRTLMGSRWEKLSSASDLDSAALNALDEMRRSGTVAIGEVANNFDTLDAIGRSGIRCRFIHELIGFRKERAGEIIAREREVAAGDEWSGEIAYAVGAHAPYSVSPELMREIETFSRERGTFVYEHLVEDPDERLLYEDAAGPWKEYLEEVGAWEPTWKPHGISPVEFYDRSGLLDDRLVAVHLADATAGEIALLARRGVRAILSPTSNLHITGKLPDLPTIVSSGMTFALGTDGRGSNPSVDVFSEARLLHERWPDTRPGLLLEALTARGAEILQFPDMGTIEPGKRPGLIAIELERMSSDVGKLESEILHGAVSRRRVV